MRDYIGDYSRVEGDIRSLDYSSHESWFDEEVPKG